MCFLEKGNAFPKPISSMKNPMTGEIMNLYAEDAQYNLRFKTFLGLGSPLPLAYNESTVIRQSARSVNVTIYA